MEEREGAEPGGPGLVDRFAEPLALGRDVDEGNGLRTQLLIHRRCQRLAVVKEKRLSKIRQPATRSGPLRDAAGLVEVSRQRVAISRLATPSLPVTAGVAPVRTACRNAISSARSGSSWPTGR